MYEKYWNLDRRPFDHHFSPALFYNSQTHESARLKLRYLIENRLGLGVLAGGIGTGKTSVARLLEQELDESCGPWITVVFPQMPPVDFLSYLATKLGSPDRSDLDHEHAEAKETHSDRADRTRPGIDRILGRIETRLRAYSEQGRRPTIVIDEAHLIDDVRVFESLQLLLNFQHDGVCSFSLLLLGGANLFGRLERIPQLNDRVGVRCLLEPLIPEETAGYVVHRLRAAGAKREIFDRRALEVLGERAAGIPRRINRLADLALVVGYAEQLAHIGAEEIEAVAEELPSAIAA